ncbi:hypothetical protein BH11PLA2_BH11PLA2_53250 [soil metagenome]
MTLNLIRLFDFYLAVMLVLGLFRRWGVYRDVIILLFQFAMHGRWPRLLGRLNTHKKEVLNWRTARPLILVLVLMIVQFIASRLIFPQATVTFEDLCHPGWQIAVVLAAMIPMVAVDLYFVIRVGRFDHGETMKYFDQAETWAGTFRAKLVKTVTLGKVNPDRMVDEQVRDGLRQLGGTVSWAMWWVSAQVVLRLLFGLTLWTMWAVQ